MSQQNPKTEENQQPQMTVNEQVSIILAHVNRAIAQVSKEAELAVMKVVSQNQQLGANYNELMKRYQELLPKDHKDKIKTQGLVTPKEPEKTSVNESKKE